LSRKAVHKWVEKFSQGRSKVADDDRPGHPVEILTEASGSVKKVFYAARLDALVKQWNKGINVCGGYVEK
jgi:hypothetical protein